MANILRPGAVIIVSAAVAAAIAVYESPQARQAAYELRRRVALALHALGDEVFPSASQQGQTHQQPRFNRPEDADGFMQSTTQHVGVDADEESQRRQREELMYWNALRLQKQQEKAQVESAPQSGNTDAHRRPAASRSQGSSFEDFLRADPSSEEKGAFVYHSGADIRSDAKGLSYRGHSHLTGSPSTAPSSDLYDASVYQPIEDTTVHDRTGADTIEKLIDISDAPRTSDASLSNSTIEDNARSVPKHVETADPVFAAIHAWADNASQANVPSGTSPALDTLASTGAAAAAAPSISMSDMANTDTDDDLPISVAGSGEATPTDTMSLAGSTAEMWHQPRSSATSDADVMSVDGGVSTPGTWTDVGSVVSEHDLIPGH